MSVDKCVQQAEKEVAKVSEFKPVQTAKDWGIEIIIADGPSYCGKLLMINRGSSSSVHKHNHIDETLYVLSGGIIVDIFPQGYHNGFSKIERYVLKEGQSIRIPPGVLHRFYDNYAVTKGEQKTQVIETSTKLVQGDHHRVQSNEQTNQP